MNNSALKLFHELMKKGWIDRNDNSLMWNLVEDNEARDELDQIPDSELGDYLHALNPNRSLPRNKKGLKRLLNVDI